MKVPTHLGREYRPFDIWGWLVFAAWLTMTYYFLSNVGNEVGGWIRVLCVISSLIMLWDSGVRVMLGRLYLIVYHDTVLRNMFEISSGGKTFFVCSENEDELALYMESFYPNLKYNIVETHAVESYLKREEYK